MLHESINKRQGSLISITLEHNEYLLLCKAYCKYSLIHLKLQKSEVVRRVDDESF
jgi:hypothetical protein